MAHGTVQRQALVEQGVYLTTVLRAAFDGVQPVAGQQRTAPAAPGVSVEIGETADAASPPVDAERVQQIRAALRDGSYPLVPTKIVDAMIAAQVSFSVPVKA